MVVALGGDGVTSVMAEDGIENRHTDDTIQFFISFLAMREKSLINILSAKVNGSSSSLSSYHSFELPSSSSFELLLQLPPALGSWKDFGSSCISWYKCFNIKRAVSGSLQ